MGHHGNTDNMHDSSICSRFVPTAIKKGARDKKKDYTKDSQRNGDI
jgi:hypothetical protein